MFFNRKSLTKYMVGGFALACCLFAFDGTIVSSNATDNAVSPGALTVEDSAKNKSEVKALEDIIDKYVIDEAIVTDERDDINNNEYYKWNENGHLISINLDKLCIRDDISFKEFPELEVIYCRRNYIKKIDITKNTKLKKLYCKDNELTEINTKNNPELTVLRCAWNKITSLDLKNNKMLITVGAKGNSLTSVNVSNSKYLRKLYLLINNISNIDLKNQFILEELVIRDNNLEKLDLYLH